MTPRRRKVPVPKPESRQVGAPGSHPSSLGFALLLPCGNTPHGWTDHKSHCGNRGTDHKPHRGVGGMSGAGRRSDGHHQLGWGRAPRQRLEPPMLRAPDVEHSCETRSCCQTRSSLKAAGLNTAETGPGSSPARRGPGNFTGGERSTGCGERGATAQPPARPRRWRDVAWGRITVNSPALEMLLQNKGATSVRGSSHPGEGLQPSPPQPSTGTAPADPAPEREQEIHLHLNTLCSSTDTSDRHIKRYQLLLSGFISRRVMKAGDERL